jgi:catechol 2,3-dioxygenase-like lactoylglutathione lyase family enzyme
MADTGNMSHPSLLLMAGLLVFAAATPAQTVATVVPDVQNDVKPIRVAGLGIRVSDLERSRKFYTEVLGLKVGAKVPAQGEPVEYLLGMSGDIRADTLIVIRKGEVKSGVRQHHLGRSERPQDGGARCGGGLSPARIVDGTNFVKDPDGYTIELYQRPAARQ